MKFAYMKNGDALAENGQTLRIPSEDVAQFVSKGWKEVAFKDWYESLSEDTIRLWQKGAAEGTFNDSGYGVLSSSTGEPIV